MHKLIKQVTKRCSCGPILKLPAPNYRGCTAHHGTRNKLPNALWNVKVAADCFSESGRCRPLAAGAP